MPSYPTVNLERPAADAPKPEPSPIASYAAHRDAWATDAPCSICQTPCSTFADAVHADGSVSGWIRVCEKCAAGHKAAAAAATPAPAVPATPPVTTAK